MWRWPVLLFAYAGAVVFSAEQKEISPVTEVLDETVLSEFDRSGLFSFGALMGTGDGKREADREEAQAMNLAELYAANARYRSLADQLSQDI